MTKGQLRITWLIVLSAFVLLCFSSTIYAKELIVKNPTTFLLTRIPVFEGFSATRYRDGVNKGCVLQGYGRCVNNKKTPSIINRSTADIWLKEDLEKCTQHLDLHFPWWKNLSIVRQAALLDMTYNLGIQKLKTFQEFLYHMQHHQYVAASNRLSKSRWSKQVGVRSKEIRYAIEHNRWKAIKK